MQLRGSAPSKPNPTVGVQANQLVGALLVIGLSVANVSGASISSDGGTGRATDSGTFGQSFTLNVPGASAPLGSNPDTVELTSFSRQTSISSQDPQLPSNSTVRYVHIYTDWTTPDTQGTFVASSTNPADWESISAGEYITWDFDNLELDYDGGTRYFAVFATSMNPQASGANSGHAMTRDTNDVYAGGDRLVGGTNPGTRESDYNFIAEFTIPALAAAVPEPSTCLLVGASLLGFIAHGRRCRNRR
jgi:hypothetical protein